MRLSYLESQTHWTKRMLFVADHDFTGKTYEAKRHDIIQKMVEHHEFYDWENNK
ncbi:MAG: hypothetical protein RLZZ453_791 [Chlamydiota bacterium]|jgi:hypothetical protein